MKPMYYIHYILAGVDPETLLTGGGGGWSDMEQYFQ